MTIQMIARSGTNVVCFGLGATLLEAAFAALAGITLLAGLAFAGAPEGKRVALVIGNGAYENTVRLDNPLPDARAVAGAFRKLGFEVIDGYDLDAAHMRAKVSAFSSALPDASSAVIYYAGHGVSVDEENYLIPTDIVLKSPTDLDLGAISVSLLLKQMKREERVNIVILDACRDNPFAQELAKHKTRAVIGERGLSRIEGDLARGTLIAFASDPKSTALDGPAGQHSPFTGAFLNHVADAGVSIDTVMSRVRAEVWEQTRHNQLPWVNTSLIGDYALNPEPAPQAAVEPEKAPPPTSPPTATGDLQSHEDLLWTSAQHSNLVADYQAYLDAFPNGVFAQMARNRIAVLAGAGAPAMAPTQTAVASVEPVAAPDRNLEVGTVETEKALKLTPADEKEIQQRLTVLDVYKGAPSGVLDSPTRSALADWQKAHGYAPSAFLGSTQLAALRAESADGYQKLLAAQPAPKQPPRQAVKPATRAARAPAKPAHAPARHVAGPRTGGPPDWVAPFATGVGAGLLMGHWR
jgi:uncharacterized caspase-like protein